MPRVALFVTCLVDLVRPRVGFAAARLLEQAGCEVVVPRQSCCGQPNYNSGDRAGAARIARAQIAAFADFDTVVAPSGSCAAMMRCHYPGLFEAGSEDRRRAEALAARTHELAGFLVAIGAAETIRARWSARATYHDACSGLRELGIKDEPRRLLRKVEGLELQEMAEAEACCGFGGTFAVKYSEISGAIAEEKCARIRDSGAQCVIAGDLGCLLNIEGKLHRDGDKTRAYHFAEVLAGLTEDEA